MPLIHVHLVKGKSAKYVQTLCDGIHEALVTAWKIPVNDRFHMVSEHKKSHFHFDPTIWGVKRSSDLVVIYITSIKRSQDSCTACEEGWYFAALNKFTNSSNDP